MLDVYAVFDKKLGEYGPNLQCEKNANMMLRNLADVLKRAPQLPLAVHASDFEVMCIGKFDEVTGRFDAPHLRLMTNTDGPSASPVQPTTNTSPTGQLELRVPLRLTDPNFSSPRVSVSRQRMITAHRR